MNQSFKNSTLFKHPGILVSLVLIIAMLAWGFWPKPIMVELVKVKKAPLTVTIQEDGRTRVIDRYVITSPINGMACRMNLKVGDTVTQGQNLLNISPLESQVLDARSKAQAQAQVSVASSALQEAKQQVVIAKANAKLASDKLKRYKPLLAKGLISQEIFDQTKTAAQTTQSQQRSAKFAVDVAQFELQSAMTKLSYSASQPNKNNLERVPVNSPITGKILKVARRCEEPVVTGEELLEVGDPTALEVEVDVLSAEAVKIKPGMKVLFDRWGGSQPLEGVVRVVEPVGFTKVSALGVEEQRVWIICDFTSAKKEWQRLGDGYRVEAQFILWQENNVLQIPSSALFRYQGGWAVFKNINNTAIRQEVKIGQRNGLSVQILAGLEDGESIINHPSDAVENNKSTQTRTND